MVRQQQTAEARLDQTTKELEQARHAIAEIRKGEAELARQMEEKMAQEREKRIKHVAQVAAHRIGRRDLARGWVSWYNRHVEQARVERMLRGAGSRLLKPKVVSAMQRWRRDWEVSCLNAQLRAVTAQLQAAQTEGLCDASLKVELQRRLDEQMALEREKRVEHTTKKAFHRMSMRDMTRGWVAWYDTCMEQIRIERMLRGAGAKLLKPKLVCALQHWRKGWEVAQLNAQLEEMASQLKVAREEGLTGAALKEELQRQLDAQMAKEREKRIEHTTEMAVRRIGKRDLARGWVAWCDRYVTQTQVKRIVAGAGGRLLKPKLVLAVQHWRKDWEFAYHHAQLQEIAAQLEAARAEGLSETTVKEEVQRQLEERMALALEDERNKRIEHLMQVAIHRIGKRTLTRGWVAWCDRYVAQKRVERLVAEAGARLLKPKLFATVQRWRETLRAEQ